MNEYDEEVKATLKFCNQLRETQGQEPLDDLPMGKRGDPHSCPCGKATGFSVSVTHAWSPFDGQSIKLPRLVSTFVELFDLGRIPEYDEEPPHFTYVVK